MLWQRKGGLTHSSLFQDRDAALDITEIERVLETRHLVASLDGNPVHHAQLLLVTGNEVEEGELVEILGLLIGQFDNLWQPSDSVCARAISLQPRLDIPGDYPALEPARRDASKRPPCRVPWPSRERQ